MWRTEWRGAERPRTPRSVISRTDSVLNPDLTLPVLFRRLFWLRSTRCFLRRTTSTNTWRTTVSSCHLIAPLNATCLCVSPQIFQCDGTRPTSACRCCSLCCFVTLCPLLCLSGSLMYLNEATLLNNVRVRYSKDKIYVSEI